MSLRKTTILISISVLLSAFGGKSSQLLAQSFDKEALIQFSQQQKKKVGGKDSLRNKLSIIYQSANLSAAEAVKSNQVWSGGVAGLSLSGTSQVIGYWDADQPLLTHQEYSGRVSFDDAEVGTNNSHATQVVGTMISSGVVASARGMADNAVVSAYNWTNDISEMATSASNLLLISSHPYAEIAGWTTNSTICGSGWTWYSLESENTSKAYQFGFYDTQAENWDSVAYLAPDYLIVKAAGNQRGAAPESQPTKHWKYNGSLNCVEDSTSVRQANGDLDGFETINSAAVAKNILVVGGVESSSNNFEDLSSIAPISGSGFGPTDDGRIKPDIVAPASNLYTPISSANDAYTSSSGGTSAATGIVAGSVALLREHYQALNSDTLSSASLRAILTQTADDIGNKGPDYKTGWGLLNTERAARFISANSSNKTKAVLKDTLLSNSSSITISYEHSSSEPLIVTMAWTDPKGTIPSTYDDPTDVILVNDLDITISSPSATTYLPWKLDRDNPSSLATTGDNTVDNIEQVVIEDAESGTYTITVSHKGTLQSGSQRVSILAGEVEPEVHILSKQSGDWSDVNTWSSGVVPSTNQHRAHIKHAVTLDVDANIRGITFDGVSAELDLEDQTLKLNGGVEYISDGVGFVGDSLSSLEILGWDVFSDSLRFKSGNEKLGNLVINTNADTVDLAGSLSIYTKLTMESGILNVEHGALTLLSNQSNTAFYEKGDGKLEGDFIYSRIYTHAGSGWRMISSPLENISFSSLNDAFFTQGGLWATNVASAPNSSLWLYNTENQSFEGYYGADSTFALGEGYLFYMFEKDSDGNQILPATLEMKGTEVDSVIVDLHRGTVDSLSYSLVGNPFAATIDWHEVVSASSDMGTSYAVWSPEEESGGGVAAFKYYNQANGIGDAGRYIAPMQGFVVQAVDESAQIKFRQNQKVANTPNKFGKETSENDDAFLNLILKDAAGKMLDNQAHLIFSQEANSGKDVSDVQRIKSLNGIENNISFVAETGGRNVFEGRFSEIQEEEISLILMVGAAGYYELEWEAFNNIPDDWQLDLVDEQTNNRIDLRSLDNYSFYQQKHSEENASSLRFKIEVKRGATDVEKTESPASYSLSQNYPNPFNPSTYIMYSLKRDTYVRLSIFNNIGQEVEVLVDEYKPKGGYNALFNSGQLASGVYYYRLQTDEFTQTRSMMLIK